MKRILILLITIIISAATFAQTQEYSMLHQGNRAYKRAEWAQAEKYYRKALEINPKNSRAMFNLGDTFLSQQNDKDALDWFTKAAKLETNKAVKAMAYHNVGYVHHKQKQYDEAIEAYKQALRLNPNDDDTRYNLTLAQKQKKQQDQQKQQQQQKQDQDKQQQDQKNKDQQQQQQQQQQDQMAQDNIDQLLNLARQTEQQTRRKLEEAKKPRRKQLGKNW